MDLKGPRTDKNGQPDYIRPEMANKMVDYPFTYRTYKPEFKAAFLVVAKAGQNFNAEACTKRSNRESRLLAVSSHPSEQISLRRE